MKGGEPALEDEEIVRLYWARNEDAIQETEKRYGSYLRNIASRILPDREDCEESINDTYLRAWNCIPPHAPERLGPFLGKLVRRASIDLLRSRNHSGTPPAEYALTLEELAECAAAGDTPQEHVELKALAESIHRFLQTLPAETRILFLRRYYFLDTLEEAAVFCSMSRPRAASLMFRARKGLKKHLRKEGFLT